MPKLLSDAQLKAYGERGFVHPLRAFGADEAVDFRRRFEAYETKHGGWYSASKGQKLYLTQKWAAELSASPAVLDAAEDILGPNLMVWGFSLFIKQPQTTSYVSWHQDSTYWGLSEPAVTTAWIALSPATTESGCMAMWPGSHKLEQVAHVDTLAKDNLLSRGQEIAVEVPEREAAMVELQPGEFSMHHVRTVHASSPNRSADRRIGIAIRYIAPHVRQVNGDWDSAWLVRGEDPFGNFEHETPPRADDDPEAVKAHARIIELRDQVLYKGVKGKPAHNPDVKVAGM
jgi:non-haem Fe2+, alpha-ketoglutarate-dependent halogenase